MSKKCRATGFVHRYIAQSLPGISPTLTPVIVLVVVFVLENHFFIHDLCLTDYVFHIPSRDCIKSRLEEKVNQMAGGANNLRNGFGSQFLECRKLANGSRK